MLKRLAVAVVLQLAVVAEAQAFTPHADCTFNKIEPLPEVENCDALDRRIKNIKSNMASAQRAMDKLREDHGDAIDDLLVQGMEVLVGEVTGMPTSAQDCVTTAIGYCRARIGAALSAAANLWSASSTFSGGIDAAIWWRRWRDKLDQLKKDLEAAEEELAECLARRSRQATERDNAEAYNRAGLPKYPPDHPLCKPPEDDPPEEEVKDKPAEDPTSRTGQAGGDPTREHAGDHDRSAGGGAGDSGDGAAPLPDWSRLNEFTREELQNALDWMERELDGCAALASGHGACVNRTLNQRTLVQRQIDKGRNASGSASEQAKWEAMRAQIGELRTRGSAIKKK
ncbi:MAG: hypothetical protein AAGG11_10025 [Pseudomonadota bacterium]